MLPKQNRLKKRTEFQYSYKHGQTKNFKEFSLVCFKRKDKLLRIGFSVSKKVGKAVVRNKVKRQMRAVVNNNIKNINRGYNLIFVAHSTICELSFAQIKDKINKALKTCNLIVVAESRADTMGIKNDNI